MGDSTTAGGEQVEDPQEYKHKRVNYYRLRERVAQAIDGDAWRAKHDGREGPGWALRRSWARRKADEVLSITAEKPRKHIYREDTLRIEITFPVKVHVSEVAFREIADIVGKICRIYEEHHPARVMWPFGFGSKITYMPMTAAEEAAGKHIEYDDDTLAIECAEREDYDTICSRCGRPQGDHKHCITEPAAGDCEFEFKQS